MVPMRSTRGGTQVMLVYASGQCMEQRSCGCSQLWHSALPGMAVGCCELRLRSTPRYRLVCNCFPDPGRGLPVKIWPGTIQVSRSRRMPLFSHPFKTNGK